MRLKSLSLIAVGSVPRWRSKSKVDRSSHLQDRTEAGDFFRGERRKRRVRAAISGMMQLRRQHHKVRITNASRRQLIMQRWNVIQHELLPELRSQLGTLTPKLEKVIHTLEWVRIEELVESSWCEEGRPPHERFWLANSFVAKSVLKVLTTRGLIERLMIDRALRRICGFPLCKRLPSESTFSRAFDEFAEGRLSARVREALVHEHLGNERIGHTSRDGTAIEAREYPVRTAPPVPAAPTATAQAAAIPLSLTSAARVTNLYHVMNAAYCNAALRDHSRSLGHVPLIDDNPRCGEKREFAPAVAIRYNERTVAERSNSRRKDEFGANHLRVKGGTKVMSHLMFGVLAPRADQLMQLRQ